MPRISKFLLPMLLALIILPALAGEGRTPIPFTAPVATPITLLEAGSYVVTRNLSPLGPGPLISIVTGPGSEVLLDLNGMVLDTTGFGVPAIEITGGGEVVIRNGALVGGGILVFGFPSRKVVIEDVNISDSVGPGIDMPDTEHFVIRRCRITDAAGAGISVGVPGGIGERDGIIEDNQIRRSFGGITVFSAQSVEISNNRIKDVFGLPGILVEDSTSVLISENTVEFVSGGEDGIRVSGFGHKVYNNLVSAAEGTGISIGSPVTGATSDTGLILNNVVHECGGDGLLVFGSGNHIDRNVLNFNGGLTGGYGLHFGFAAFDNTFGRNTAVGNAGFAPCGFPPFSADLCDDVLFPGAINVSFGDNLVPPGAGLF